MLEVIGQIEDVKDGVEWVIPDFLSLQAGYRSPTFSFAAASWELMIYVYPMQADVGPKIQLGLERTKSGGPPIHLEFSFSVKARDGKKCKETPWIDFRHNTDFCPGHITIDSKRMRTWVPNGTLTVVCTLKHKEISPEETGLGDDFKQLFLSQEDSDAILRVKEREFKAHRIILKARSPVFKSIFQSDMKENATGIVDIQDLDPSAFSDFLCFLYCGELDGDLSKDNVFDLYTAADKYDVKNLRANCVEFMEKNLSVRIFCDVVRLALLHSETKLIKLSTEFFVKNASKIIKTAEWKTFVTENPVQSSELFMKLIDKDERK